MKKTVSVLCVLMLLLLTACAQPVLPKMNVPADQRGVFSITTQDFVAAFNAKMTESRVERPIGELQQSEAGAYDRYTYTFDKYNMIAFDCPRKTDQISAIYLAYAKKGLSVGASEAQNTGTAPFGSFLPVIIHIAGGKNAEETRSILDALGITTVSSPQNGFKQEHRESGLYYSLSVENETIVFAMGRLNGSD